MDVVVSRGATLNAYNNTDGVLVDIDSSDSTLTVEKGGAVIACGNNGDLVGPGTVTFFPTSGKRYTCNSVANANGFTCENTCPVCPPN